MRTTKTVLPGLALLAALTASSYAVTLVEGTTVTLPGTTVLLRPELAGTVVEDDSVPFAINLPTGGNITGTIQERVVREDGTGTLDFYWRVLSDANSAGVVGYFRLGHFINGSYDADWRIDGLGVTSTANALLFGGSLSGLGFINFGFAPDLAPGNSSTFMFLHTDAIAYNKTAFMDVATPGTTQDSDQFPTFSPVPEPATVTLVGLSALGALALRRRK
jgi:hypothetical protein